MLKTYLNIIKFRLKYPAMSKAVLSPINGMNSHLDNPKAVFYSERLNKTNLPT